MLNAIIEEIHVSKIYRGDSDFFLENLEKYELK